ncbi:MAG: PEP-CTERM system TPR-repeat protein PrsT, partial [Betaproteobacteria bacterium]|nr:PEP-CTERM system TPR-repeat protein PrsT [Betaproteobacteria bacterium]
MREDRRTPGNRDVSICRMSRWRPGRSRGDAMQEHVAIGAARGVSWRALAGTMMTAAVFALSGCGSHGGDAGAFLESGKELLAANDFAGAVIQFKNAVKAAPESGDAHLALGMALRRQTDLQGALIEMQRAETMHASPDRLYPQLVSLLIDIGKPDEALSKARSAEVTTTGARLALRALTGDALYALQRLDEARKIYAEVLATDPKQSIARVGQARLALADGEFERALGMLRAIVADDGNAPSARYLIGTTLSRLGRRKEAVEALDEAIRADPGDRRAYLAVIGVLVASGDVAGAKARLDALEKTLPIMVSNHLMKAMIAHASGDNFAAREHVEIVLRANPDYPNALLLAGTIELELGNSHAAEKYLVRVLNVLPDEPQARRMLVSAYLQRGMLDRAAEMVEPLERTRGDELDTLIAAGEVALARGDTDGAIKRFERASTAFPDDEKSRLGLARALLREGRRNAAAEALREAIRIGPRSPAGDQELVALLMRQGDTAGALSIAEACVKRLPEHPGAHTLLGSVLMDTQKHAEARSEFERAVALRSDYLPAITRLAMLDLMENKAGEARKRLSTLVAKEPRNDDAVVLLAVLMQKTGAPGKDVLSLLDEAIRANATSPKLRLAKTDYLVGAGNVSAALESAQAAQTVLPDDPDVLYSLARVQRMSGQFDQARMSYGQLPAISGRTALSLFGQAQVYLLSGELDTARELLRSSITADPDQVQFRRALVDVDVHLHDREQAYRDARAIQKRWPNAAEGYLAEATAAIAFRDNATAERALRAGLAQAGRPELLAELVQVLGATHRTSEA